MVADQLDCTFLCVGEPKCYSFNMAAYPDSKGLYLCELLVTDKYRATEKFHANATFHYHSPSVRFLVLFCFFLSFVLFFVLFFSFVLSFVLFSFLPYISYNSGLTLSYFIFSLHVKALLARTVLFVFLNMNGTPITVTVSLDSVELTVNEVIY